MPASYTINGAAHAIVHAIAALPNGDVSLYKVEEIEPSIATRIYSGVAAGHATDMVLHSPADEYGFIILIGKEGKGGTIFARTATPLPAE